MARGSASLVTAAREACRGCLFPRVYCSSSWCLSGSRVGAVSSRAREGRQVGVVSSGNAVQIVAAVCRLVVLGPCEIWQTADAVDKMPLERHYPIACDRWRASVRLPRSNRAGFSGPVNSSNDRDITWKLMELDSRRERDGGYRHYALWEIQSVQV